jgi:hypothetical protein
MFCTIKPRIIQTSITIRCSRILSLISSHWMHPVIHTTSPVKRNWEPSCKEDQIWSIYAGTKSHQKSTQILYNRLLSNHKEAGKATLPIPNIKLLSTSLISCLSHSKGGLYFWGVGICSWRSVDCWRLYPKQQMAKVGELAPRYNEWWPLEQICCSSTTWLDRRKS